MAASVNTSARCPSSAPFNGFLEPEEDSLLSVFSDLSVPSTSNFPLSPFSDLLDTENSNHTPPSTATSNEFTGNSDSDSISFASEIINLIIETDESALSTIEETAEQRQSPYRRDDVSYLNVLVHRLAREALNGGQAISWKSIQDWALQAKGQLDKSGTLQFRATDLWICRFLRKHNVHSRKYNQERSEVKNSHSTLRISQGIIPTIIAPDHQHQHSQQLSLPSNQTPRSQRRKILPKKFVEESETSLISLPPPHSRMAVKPVKVSEGTQTKASSSHASASPSISTSKQINTQINRRVLELYQAAASRNETITRNSFVDWGLAAKAEIDPMGVLSDFTPIPSWVTHLQNRAKIFMDKQQKNETPQRQTSLPLKPIEDLYEEFDSLLHRQYKEAIVRGEAVDKGDLTRWALKLKEESHLSTRLSCFKASTTWISKFMKKYGIASEKELIKVIDGRLHQRYLEAISAGQTVTRKQLQNWGKDIRQDILTQHGKIKCIVSNKWMRRFLQRWNIQLADETTTILPGTKAVAVPKVPSKSTKEVKDKLKRVRKSKDSSKVTSPLPTVNLPMVPPPPPGLGTPFSGPVSMTLDINSEGSEFSAWDQHHGFDSPLTMPLLSEQILDHQCLTAEQLTPPAEDEMSLKTEESDHQYWTMLNLPEPMQVEEVMSAPKMESLLSPASFSSSVDEKPALTPSTPTPPKTTVSTPESKEAAAKLSSAILSSQSAAVQKLLLKNFDSLKAVLENMDIDPTVEYAIIMNESQVLNVMPITAEVREILAQDALYQASIKEGTANSQKQ